MASPNAKDTNMLVFLALGNAKVLYFALGDAKVPNAKDFAFWWNIGFTLLDLCEGAYVHDDFFRICGNISIRMAMINNGLPDGP